MSTHTDRINPDYRVVWEAQRGPQEWLLSCPIFEVFFGGARGGGKGLPADTPVLTPFGWREIGSLAIGSKVCATDGTVTEVIGVYHRGNQPIYRLTWSDGVETVCDADHIWLAWLSNKSRKIGNKRLSGEASAKKWTTAQIAEHYRKQTIIKRRIAIPVISSPVAFNVSNENHGRYVQIGRMIPPYVLGVLLGDGAISGEDARFTSADKEVADRIGFLMKCSLLEYNYESKAKEYRIPRQLIIADLKTLGVMGKRAENKSIPRIYMLGSASERWELLRGLMDTDGWADADGDCYFCSVSEDLIRDVRELARSLGAVVTTREKQPFYLKDGERINGRSAQTLRIKIREPERLFHLSRKQAICAGKTPQSMAVWLDSIEPAGEQETVCIQISHPNSLFIIDGYRVTHNSDGMLGDFASHADEFGADAIGLIIRRELVQLKELIERSKQIYGVLGATWHVSEKMWRFPNGARLVFAYVDNDDDADKYQGNSYSRVYVEEMGNFPSPTPILKLMACIRSANPKVRCGFRATGNPGGPGHLWIKQRYIMPAPSGMQVIKSKYVNPFTEEEYEQERVFIPSKVTDNKFNNNQQYIARLQMVGNARLVKAWLLGNWDIIEGAYFDEWDEARHVIPQFIIPAHWTRFTSMDWGSARPFSIGWWAIVPDKFDVLPDQRPSEYDPRFAYKNNLPRGALVRYREWYGCQVDENGVSQHNNVGLKLTIEQMASGIAEREKKEPRDNMERPRIAQRVADPSIFKQDGGPSFAERMAAAPYYQFWTPADNTRVGRKGAVGGWDMVRARLIGQDGEPMIYFFPNCVDSIRTLPAAQHDKDNIEDIDSSGEDHCIDEIRYMCNARPYTRPEDGPDKGRVMKVGLDNKLQIKDVMGEFEKPKENKFVPYKRI